MKKAFNIDDINVWMLLLKQRPNRRTLDEKSVKIYTDIAKNLELVSKAHRSGIHPWNRAKYRLLEDSGTGRFKSNQIKSNQIKYICNK